MPVINTVKNQESLELGKEGNAEGIECITSATPLSFKDDEHLSLNLKKVPFHFDICHISNQRQIDKLKKDVTSKAVTNNGIGSKTLTNIACFQV